MSNAFAISATTAVLQHYLGNALGDVSALFGGPVALSAKAPDIFQKEIDAGTALNQVNLFMHQVTYNQGWRNVDLASLSADGRTPLKSPPMALDLHYLLTVYGSDDWQAEALLGHCLLMLHQFPVIARKDITTALTALPAGPFAVALKASGLADQIEMIKVTPSPLGREEMAWLWTALKADYRPTFPFQASVVLMQPESPISLPLPVLSRNIVASATQPAQLLSVSIPDKQISAAAGDLVTVNGEFLTGASQVTLSNPRLGVQVTIPATSVLANSLQFTVPAEVLPTYFPAGIYDLAVQFLDPLKNLLQTTGSLPIAIAPVIQLAPAPIVVKSASETLVTLTFSPYIQLHQSASLTIGSQSVPALPFSAITNQLTFRFVPPLASGIQLARLLIDNSPSQVLVNWPTTPATLPTFKNPLVTI